MRRPWSRLLLGLLAAGAVSFLVGLGATEIMRLVPCQGEGLVCNINQAIGSYGVVILAVLGPIIYGVSLLIARNRTVLLGVMIVLLVPIMAFYLIVQTEHALNIGLEPYRQFRTLLVMVLPPALTVVVQYFVLRFALQEAERAAA
jgi:nitrate/nitrite transporter NarK